MTLPAFSTPKLIGMAVGALALVAALLWFRGVLDERAELRAWQADVVAVTREAAANPKLSKKLVGQQIRLLGTGLAQCKAGTARQNAAIEQLAATTAEQGKAADEAAKRSAERIAPVEATRRGLEASSRSSEAQAKPCAPSKALTEAWQ